VFFFFFRDIAAKNFLLDENIFTLKLADFGSVVELNENYNSLEIDLDRSLPIRWIAYEVYTSSEFNFGK
jgi:serine/threonine protein kinase